MRVYGGERPRGGAALARNLFIVAAVCLGLRAASAALEPGGRALPEGLGLAALALELPGVSPGRAPTVTASPPPVETEEPEAPPEEPEIPDIPEEPEEPEAPPEEPPPEEPEEPEEPEPPEEPENKAIGTTITGSGGGYTSGGEGIYLKNRTGYDIDVEDYLSRPLGFSALDGAAVLIIHTHGSEAYNPAGDDVYVESDPSRTQDIRYNVVRVGDELERVLTARGVRVVHDRQLYDYPSYTGSYTRSMESIKAHLEEDPDIAVVIDLHRDALEGDGKLYKTVADVGDAPCAQVMLICGTNWSGLNHPDWQENLTFAMHLQERMVVKYPTLARPLKISEYRYNQNATTGSLIAEVGTNGNTLREALTAVRYFGECLADVLTGEDAGDE